MHQSTERDPLIPSSQYDTPEPETINSNKVSRSTLIWILLGLWSAVFLGALDGTIVATLLSPIGSYFQESHKASYLGTSYLLSVCCFTPLYGRLSDILGRKYAMLLGLSLFTFGTLLCGLAPSMNILIISRGIAGMGGGGIMTVSSISASDLIPLKQRGLFQGLANIMFGLGAGIGGPLGGWISDYMGWRWAFLFQIPLLALSMIIVALKVNIQLPPAIVAQSTSSKLRRIDWLGSLTLVSFVGCLLLSLSLKTSEDIPWSDPLVWGLLIVSFISGILFVLVEAKWSSSPVMPLGLLTQRTPMAVAIANFLVSMTAFSMLYNVPLYFQAVKLVSSSEAGLHLVPNSIALSIGSVTSGVIMRRTGKLYNLTLASAIMTVLSCILVATWREKTTASLHFWLDIVPNGFGGSSVITSTLIALIASVPREDMAIATGISYLFRTTGQVLSVSLSGALVQGVLVRELHKRITAPGSEEIIQRIRHETGYIMTLPASLQAEAVLSYEAALRAVFICQVGIALLTFFSCLFIEENPLPGSLEEQDEADRKRRERRGINS